MDDILTGVYPIICDNQRTGELTVSREGAFYVFEAAAEMRDGLLRLSVYGSDGEGYLGVMQPEGGALTLKRRLSRAALKSFPSRIAFAAPSGSALPAPSDAGECSEPESPPPESGNAPLKFCANPCSLFSDALEKSAFGGVRRARAKESGGVVALYVPKTEASRLGLKGVREGDYEVFFIKDGRLM